MTGRKEPADPYVYPGTDVLRNHQGIRDPAQMETVEAATSTRALTRLATDPLPGRYDFRHLAAFHQALFGELYPFAGQPRTVPLTKPEISLGGRSVRYATPETTAQAAEQGLTLLRGGDWSRLDQIGVAARFASAVATTWQAHPFRDGNTRTTMALVRQFAHKQGVPLDFGVLARIPNETRNALALASERNLGTLTGLIADARRSEIARSHPVLGRVTSETREVLELMGNPRVSLPEPGSPVRGTVLAISYQAVLVRGGTGVTAVALRNLAEVPSNNARVALTVRYTLPAAAAAAAAAAPGQTTVGPAQPAPPGRRKPKRRGGFEI